MQSRVMCAILPGMRNHHRLALACLVVGYAAGAVHLHPALSLAAKFWG